MDIQNNAGQNKTVIPVQEIDYSSALSLAETRTITDAILVDFCGILRIPLKNGSYEYRRISKPIITYDFANKLLTGVYNISNRITARTTFTQEEIKMYCYTNGSGLMMDMAVDGMQHIISDRVWEHASKLYEISSCQEIDGKKHYINGWMEKGYTLNYDSPFNIDHLNFIKNTYNLNDESFGQDIILKKVFWQIMTFIHGSLNRSKDALTLDHEKIIHKESIVQSENTSTKPQENFIDNIKDSLKKLSRRVS